MCLGDIQIGDETCRDPGGPTYWRGGTETGGMFTVWKTSDLAKRCPHCHTHYVRDQCFQRLSTIRQRSDLPNHKKEYTNRVTVLGLVFQKVTEGKYFNTSDYEWEKGENRKISGDTFSSIGCNR